MNREEAILRELNLYPFWQRRGKLGPVSQQDTRNGLSVSVQLSEKSVMEKKDRQDPGESNWYALRAMVENCTACGLRAGCTQTVFGMGDVQADWMFVGECPGPEEDMQGKPFAGQSGKLLDNMLAAIKLQRGHNVYCTNVVKCCPSGNRTPESNEIAQCMPYLEREIQFVQPKLIVVLGKAASLLLGQGGTLSDLRGRLHDFRVPSAHGMERNIPLVVTHHPADLLQTPLKKAEAWEDLCLAVVTMQGLASD